MIVTAEVKSADWTARMDELVVLMEQAGKDASLESAQAIQEVTRANLSHVKHSEYTYGAPSGESPWMVDGNLFASIDAAMVGDQAWVGPTAGYGRSGSYARILELGGEMHGHPMMIYFKFGFTGAVERIEREFVALAPRPYLEPATHDVISSGRLTAIYIDHWTAAIEEAAA